MVMSHGKTFITVLALLGMVAFLHWPGVVQAGGAGEACVPPAAIPGIDCPIRVEVVIKPGEAPPSINPRSHGVIPVAVLTGSGACDDPLCFMDATSIDPGTVFFEDAAPVDWALEDVNGDGLLDLLFHFRTQDTGLQCGFLVPGAACLGGLTFPTAGGIRLEINGCDQFQTVGCQGQ